MPSTSRLPSRPTPTAAWNARLAACPSRVLTTVASTDTAAYTRSRGREHHSSFSAMTRSVMRPAVSLDTLAP